MRNDLNKLYALSVGFALLTFTLPAFSDADLVVTKSVSDPRPAPGNPVEFTVTITNDGPDAVTGIEVTDRLPQGLTIPAGTAPFTSQGLYDSSSGIWETGSLQPLDTAVLTVTAVASFTTSPMCHANLARISSTNADDPQSTNDWSIAAIYSSGSTDCARLTLLSSMQQAPGTGSPTVVLNVDIWNDGPDTAKGVGVRLSGVENAGNLDTDSFFGDLPAAHTLNATASWTYDCGLAAFTEDYTLTVYTESTAASDSVLTLTDSILVPRTGACSIPDALAEGVSSGGCFIATAAYGSSLDSHVDTLRSFRDDYLMPNAMGRKFVDLYYRYSPPIAAFIAKHDSLRLITRVLLTPIIYAIAFPTIVFLTACAVVAATLAIIAGRRREKISGNLTAGPFEGRRSVMQSKTFRARDWTSTSKSRLMRQ